MAKARRKTRKPAKRAAKKTRRKTAKRRARRAPPKRQGIIAETMELRRRLEGPNTFED